MVLGLWHNFAVKMRKTRGKGYKPSNKSKEKRDTQKPRRQGESIPAGAKYRRGEKVCTGEKKNNNNKVEDRD